MHTSAADVISCTWMGDTLCQCLMCLRGLGPASALSPSTLSHGTGRTSTFSKSSGPPHSSSLSLASLSPPASHPRSRPKPLPGSMPAALGVPSPDNGTRGGAAAAAESPPSAAAWGASRPVAGELPCLPSWAGPWVAGGAAAGGAWLLAGCSGDSAPGAARASAAPAESASDGVGRCTRSSASAQRSASLSASAWRLQQTAG